MSERCIACYVAAHIDGIQQLLLRLIEMSRADIEIRRRQRAVVGRLESILCLGHRFGYVLGAEVYVEGGKGTDQLVARHTLPQILDGVQCGLEIRAGRMHCYANGRVPAAVRRELLVKVDSVESILLSHRSSKGTRLSRNV